MAVKPLKWSLKKVTSHELALLDSVYGLIPSGEMEQRLALDMRKMLMKHLGEKSFYYLDTMQSASFGEFAVALPEYSVLAVIGAEPLPGKIILNIDSSLVFLLIDRLLGGNGEPMVESRPLTETEQGVLQYFIMQVLSQIWKAGGSAADAHFRFERFMFDPVRSMDVIGEREKTACVNFKIGIGELGGFLKIFIPEQTLSAVSAKAQKRIEESDIEAMPKRAANFDYLRTTIWADAGRVNVNPDEIAQIEPGDVILLDETGLDFSNGVIAGEVELRVGKGEEGSIKASVEGEKRRLRCTLLGG